LGIKHSCADKIQFPVHETAQTKSEEKSRERRGREKQGQAGFSALWFSYIFNLMFCRTAGRNEETKGKKGKKKKRKKERREKAGP